MADRYWDDREGRWRYRNPDFDWNDDRSFQNRPQYNNQNPNRRYTNARSPQAHRDLERGTIFDRSHRNRGNFDIEYDEDDYDFNYGYGNVPGRYAQDYDWDQNYSFNRYENPRQWDQGRNRNRRMSRNYGNRIFETPDLGNQDIHWRSNFGDEYYDPADWWDYDNDPYEMTPTITYTEYWWFVPGPFEGVGPRGYQRSDNRICEDIGDRLSQHGRLDASNIEVDVNNGEVTLKGEVNDRRSKRIAGDIADSVSGVNDVHNQLRVRHSNRKTGQNQKVGQGQETSQN